MPRPATSPSQAGAGLGAAPSGAAAGLSGAGKLILTAVGGAAAFAIVAAIAFFVIRGPLATAWRRRRRGMDSEEAAAPMHDRTGRYRWYEDAETIAADIERRGEAVQQVDGEGVLCVPTMIESIAARRMPLAPRRAMDDAALLADFEAATAPINPLLAATR